MSDSELANPASIEPGQILVADPNRPTAEELTRCQLVGVRLISAAQRGDMAAPFIYTPKSTTDLQYVLTAATELAAEVIQIAGLDPVDVLDDLRRLAYRRHRDNPQGVPATDART